MDFKEIKNTKHYLYDTLEEFMISYPDSVVRHNWRHGEEGEWVFTDDGFVCQILRKSKIKDKNRSVACVRTVCGTYLQKDKKKEMLGENGIAENIYTFSGTNVSQKDFNERSRNSRELLFAKYVASGLGVVEAYQRAYPDARSSNYIKARTDKLLKTETIRNMIDKQIEEILNEEGVTPNWLIERYKTIADLAESDTAKLRSLDSLSKISGLFDTGEKKSEEVTIWAGFKPEQLEEVKKHGETELIAHAEKTEND
tara:strand:- start:304 stop:1068 length:765 start_codon:yes stop_codon:yes gene_type:complete